MNEMERRVAGILDAAVKNGEMTGAGALVLRGGREVCCVQAGLAERIYLEEGAQVLYEERRGRSSAADGTQKEHPAKVR